MEHFSQLPPEARKAGPRFLRAVIDIFARDGTISLHPGGPGPAAEAG